VVDQKYGQPDSNNDESRTKNNTGNPSANWNFQFSSNYDSRFEIHYFSPLCLNVDNFSIAQTFPLYNLKRKVLGQLSYF
jgi:hypothetical protein